MPGWAVVLLVCTAVVVVLNSAFYLRVALSDECDRKPETQGEIIVSILCGFQYALLKRWDEWAETRLWARFATAGIVLAVTLSCAWAFAHLYGFWIGFLVGAFITLLVASGVAPDFLLPHPPANSLEP